MHGRWKCYKKSPAPADLQFYPLPSCLVFWLCFNTLRLPQSSTLTLQRDWQHKTNAADRAVLKRTRFYHAVILFTHKNAPSNLGKNGDISIYYSIWDLVDLGSGSEGGIFTSESLLTILRQFLWYCPCCFDHKADTWAWLSHPAAESASVSLKSLILN